MSIALEQKPAETVLKSKWWFVPVRISSVVDLLPYEVRVAFMSLLAHEGSFEDSKL